MKFHGTTKIMVPFFNPDGTKDAAVLNFNGTLDRRRFYRTVIRFVKMNFGRTVSKRWVKSCPMINEPKPPIVTDAMVEDFIQRMETNDEDQDQPDTGTESTPAVEAGDEVRSLSDQFNVHAS